MRQETPTHLSDSIVELRLSIPSTQHPGSHVNESQLSVVVVFARVDIHIPLTPRPFADLALSLSSFAATFSSHVLDKSKDLADDRSVRFVLFVFVIFKTLLAALHQTESLVDVTMFHDVCESKTCKCLGKAEHAKQCTR